MGKPAKRWPTKAEWARTDSLIQAKNARLILLPVLESSDAMSTAEITRRVGLALDKLNEIHKLLMSVGPQTEKQENER